MSEVNVSDGTEQGIRIEAHEMISELTNKVSQLTLDGIMKDMIIRKLEEQLRENNS